MLNEEQAWVFTYGLFIVTLLMLAWNSRWHLLQGVIFIAVVCSNIHWQWTPNTALACYIGAGLAFGATALINWIIDRRNPPAPPPTGRTDRRTRKAVRRRHSALTLRQKAL